MYHENLKEWLTANHLYYKDLARDVKVRSLGHYTRKGKMFPPEYIDTWRKRYGWTDRQTFLFQYERPMQEAFEEQPESYTPEEISQAITKLLRKETAAK